MQLKSLLNTALIIAYLGASARGMRAKHLLHFERSVKDRRITQPPN